jgi:NitT/TauT family transport system substrate-binding protein
MWSVGCCQFRSRCAAVAAFAALLLCCFGARAEDLPVVRVGTLKFGTVNWELDVMARHGLDRARGFALKPMDFAGKDGAAVALQGGEVDVILTDWLWVAKRRAMGGDFTFAPHSHVTGALMVRKDAGIATLADLKGKKIGIGGGPADKSWILLRAYAQKSAGFDPAHDSTPVFAAPPLLNVTLMRGELPAALNFWQYNARLPADQVVPLVRIEDMLPALGLPADMPLLGWVFSESWAKAHAKEITAYLAAAAEARHILATSPEEWQKIKPMTGAADDATLVRLREAYKGGVMAESEASPAQLEAEAQIMADLLAKLGDTEEAPPGGKVPRGTFFAGPGA